MLEEIRENLQKQMSQKEWNQLKQKKFHLGVFAEPYLEYMLQGKKIIESRFSKHQIAPLSTNYQRRYCLNKKIWWKDNWIFYNERSIIL